MKNFYKVLFTLFLFGSSFSILNAQLLFSESFNTTGTIVGNGWIATTSTGGATPSVGPVTGFGLGNSATITTPNLVASVSRYDKPLGGTYAGDGDPDGTNYWLGFWLKTAQPNTAATGSVAAQIILLNSGGSATILDQRIGAGKTSNFTGATSNVITAFTRASSGGCAAQNWPASLAPASPATAPIAIAQNTPVYILMKITKGEYTANFGTPAMPEKLDAIRVWVLSAPPSTESSLSAMGDFTTLDATTMMTIPIQTRLLRSSGNTGNTAATCRQSGVDGIRIRVEGVATSESVTASFDEIRFAKGTLSAVLPIELADISAFKKGTSNIVKWTTASENNNKGFHIERSSDASTWETIGFVKGAGNAQAKLNYSFTDNTPLSISYYRLRQEDNDGRTTHTKVVSVAQNGRLNVKIAPNPAKDVVNISLDKESEKNFVTVYDVVGRSVATAQFSGNQSELNVSNLIKGIYFINVQTDGKTVTQKFFKE
jgi:Secretion system C-terminal sorting domain